MATFSLMAHTGATDPRYTERLIGYESRWKRFIGAHLPYRWNVRRMTEGRVMEVGCGVGRVLAFLDDAVGVDTNLSSVREARRRGFKALTAEELESKKSDHLGAYDTLLFAHVLEHMTNAEGSQLVGAYLPYLAPGGQVVVIVPQEAGFRSDPTHIEPLNRAEIACMASDNALELKKVFSFPLPSWMGRWFRHNETVALLRPDRVSS